MSHEITLPSGATAMLREADDLTFGDRDDVLQQFNVDTRGQLQDSGARAIVLFQHAVITFGVESWTVTDKATGDVLPIPSVDPTSVRRLSIKDGSYLYQQLKYLRDELFPDFDVAQEESSPTGPSAG